MSGIGDQSCGNWIPLDVSDESEQVCVAIDQDGGESPLQEVPGDTVSSVEGLRIGTVDVPHQLRQVGLTRL